MVNIDGYVITEELNQGKYFSTYRALRETDKHHVILKMCRFEQPTFAELATLKHEYHLLTQLDYPGIVKVHELTKHQHQLVLVLEDIQGYSLKKYLAENPLNLTDFFNLALQLVDALHALQLNNIIHKDINPNNIIIEPKTLALQIVDFSISSQVTQENQALMPANLEGTLAYLSPEQTGRINCLVDYRADFYSLGITFFEMLTTKLPFESNDLLELIYNHLAKPPPDITEIKSDIPKALANIVTKLMAKLPEQRYASAAGLKADLINCQNQWSSKQQIEPFVLGQQDFSSQLHLSQKLYGREIAIEQLTTIFNRTCQGSAELLLIAGYSGIGKSSVVKEIYKPLTKQKGYFISGKFDQLQHSTPYSAIIVALQDLMQRLLTESNDFLADIKQILLTTLGSNGQVIIDIIPNLVLIIGEQPPLPKLTSEQTQSRFILTFQNFLSALGQPDHPLVLFLDDLQWADTASLQLLREIATATKLQYCLLIGAYRDNEVLADHPLNIMLQTLKKTGITINRIDLKPLILLSVNQLLADSFNCSIEDSCSLAKLIFDKTQGNPFFVNEFIKMLYQHQLIKFSQTQHQWQWDFIQIEQQNITDNVIDLLLAQLLELSETVQKTLATAACVGQIFNLQMLALISQQTLATTSQRLLPLLANSYIKTTSENYQILELLTQSTDDNAIAIPEKIYCQFVHDRIQQTAYSLNSDKTKSELHLRIGQILLQKQILQKDDEQLFELLNHFNHSTKIIVDPAEQLQLSEYNLLAGQKAKASCAYQAASTYLEASIVLMANFSWEKHYNLLFKIHKEYAECQRLVGDYQQTEQTIQLLIKHAQNKLELAEVYAINIAMLNTQGQHANAIALGLVGLKNFGYNLPKKAQLYHIIPAMLAVRMFISGKDISNLNLPLLTNSEQRACEQLMVQMLDIAFLIDQNLFVLLVNKILYLNLKYGYTTNFPFICALSAHISINALSRYDEGCKFTELGKSISKQLPNNTNGVISQRFIDASFVNYYKDSLANSLSILLQCYQQFLEVGNLVYAFYSLGEHDLHLLALGRPLTELQQGLSNQLSFTAKHNITDYAIYLPALAKAVNDLQTEQPLNFLPDITKFAASLDATANNAERGQSYYYYILLSYLSGDYNQTLQACELNTVYLPNLLGMPIYSQINFLHALAITHCYEKVDKSIKKIYLKKLNILHKLFKKWTQWCPENFSHYDLLISAERMRLNNDMAKAADYYELAIKAAHHNNFNTIIGIANEAAANFYISWHKPNIAKIYLQAAHYVFSQWGALAKCRTMETQYPNFELVKPLRAPASTVATQGTISSKTETSLTSIDILSILKSAQIISSEIQLDKLLQKLLYILLENAGAEYGMLLMKENSQWFVKAKGTIAAQQVMLNQAELVETCVDIPLTLIYSVQRSQQQMLLQSLQDFEPYIAKDSYLTAIQPKSLLIMPILYQNELSCLFYLENRSISCAFGIEQIQTLQLLASQASISVTNALLYYQATHDNLTGLSNRNLLYHLFQRAQAKAKRNNTSIAILFFDLDGFKKINDTLGHAAGDKLLLHFTALLNHTVRETDLATRLGGDEFIVMMEDVTNPSAAANFAERFLKSLNTPIEIAGQLVTPASSIGISVFPKDGDDIQTLLKNADTALYRVKAAGKNFYQFYS